MSEIVEVVEAEYDLSVPLDRTQAEALTAHIRNAADVMYVLIARAHAGRVWEALDYPSWEAYVRDEFNMSRSRAYQLLDQAKVVAEIQAAAPIGTQIDINEKTARDLKKVLGEVTGEIADRTDGMTPEEAEATIDDVLNEYRSQSAEFDNANGAPSDGSYGYSGSGDLIDDIDVSDFAADFDEAVTGEDPAPAKATPAATGVDPAALRRTVQACYDLYASLSSLKSMPEVSSVVNAIPVERHGQVTENLDPAIEWLAEFAATWKSRADG